MMRSMLTFAKPGFRGQHVPAGMVKDPPSSLHFSCSNCEAQDEPSVHLIETARIVQGVRYCSICGGAMVDDVVFKVFCDALNGVVTWGKGRKAHALHAALRNPYAESLDDEDPDDDDGYVMETTCNCHGHGVLKETFPNPHELLVAFAAFVEDEKHFPALKAIANEQVAPRAEPIQEEMD